MKRRRARSSTTVIPMVKPVYSSAPRQTDDGRPFAAVHASEDLSFDPAAAKAPDAAAGGSSSRTDPLLPQSDGLAGHLAGAEERTRWGWTISLSMKARPRMVRSSKSRPASSNGLVSRQSLATMSAIVRPVRVPGTVQLDERRISVVSTRTEAFVEEVADITTGQLVEQGPSLWSRLLRPRNRLCRRANM